MAVSASPRVQATPGWPPAACLPFLVHLSWLAPGILCCLPQPQEPLHRTLNGDLFRSGGMGAELGCQDPNLNSISGKGQGTWGCLCLKDRPQATMGTFLSGVGESLSGGGAEPGSQGIPISAFVWLCAQRGYWGLPSSMCLSPWEPEGLSEEGRKCAQGWGWEEEFQQCTPPGCSAHCSLGHPTPHLLALAPHYSKGLEVPCSPCT